MLIILTTLYNAENYIGRCIESIKAQSHGDFRCFITNDLSTDDSLTVVGSAIRGDDRFTVLNNAQKMYQPGNYWQVLSDKGISEDDIAITIDGDDWLPDDNVFARIIETYKDQSVLMTYGQFVMYHSLIKCTPGWAKPVDFDTLRTFTEWNATHLRTFKVGLFRRIKEEDLIAPSGNYWEVAGDLAFMIPMLEMSGPEHSRFLPEVNYVYNVETGLNDFKTHAKLQWTYTDLIKYKERYKRLCWM